GFFGVVQMADPVAAQEFFAKLTGQWQRCNGQTVAMRPAVSGAGEISRITGVSFDARVVSASVLHTSGGTGSPTGIRAVGRIGGGQ
ncbi:sensor domain-containing protein, partial [Mycolicibacterium vaccae]|nr:sensor domain-containing protein [Mycolicibacterium vaccae]